MRLMENRRTRCRSVLPARIAAVSGLVTVGDFRTGDMALGGQGAPLAPVFHDWLFRQPGEDRVVVNIGGIANLSVLAADGGLTGFDTGPGNTLLDAWAQEHLGTQFDEDGKWARSGTMQPRLLETLLADEYFETEPPKSTGPEHFNLDWLGHAGAAAASPADVQATLVELTAASIAAAVRTACPRAAVAVCGGGASNGFLMERLAARLWAPRPVSTQEWGIHPGLGGSRGLCATGARSPAGRAGQRALCYRRPSRNSPRRSFPALISLLDWKRLALRAPSSPGVLYTARPPIPGRNVPAP